MLNFQQSIFEPNFKLAAIPSSNIDLGLPRNGLIREIIENPININAHIIDPTKIQKIIEDKIPERSLDLPTVNGIMEKQAARLIVIRRHKMRKHKLRKLRKKMKFLWRKLRVRRQIKKEKAFHAELLAQIREAENFDAKTYVASRLEILDNVRIPSKWRGEVLPEATIRQFMREKEEKRKRMNPPRLPL